MVISPSKQDYLYDEVYLPAVHLCNPMLWAFGGQHIQLTP